TRRWQAVLLALVVLGAAPPARAVPDLSGTWELDKGRSSGQTDNPLYSMVSAGNVTMVIEHREPSIKMERHGSLGYRERILAAVYYTDGRESSNKGPRGEAMTAKAHWDKNALVIDQRITPSGGSGPVATRKDVWSLADDGTLVMESTKTEPGREKPES